MLVTGDRFKLARLVERPVELAHGPTGALLFVDEVVDAQV